MYFSILKKWIYMVHSGKQRHSTKTKVFKSEHTLESPGSLKNNEAKAPTSTALSVHWVWGNFKGL